MGHGRKLILNATEGRLGAFGLALCSDHRPGEGMVGVVVFVFRACVCVYVRWSLADKL